MRATDANAPSSLPSTPTARLVGHEGPIHVVKFSHDGKYCISAGHDRTVRLWNPTRVDPAYASTPSQSYANVGSPHHERPIDSIPHALPIQAYSDGHTHPISAIDLDDSSTTLLSSSDKTLVVTDVITRKLKRRFQGHTGRINSVACSSGGEVLLSASYDGTVRIWDGRSFSTNPVQTLSDATDSVSCVKVLQKEGELAEIVTACIDGSVRSYDLRRGLIHVDDLGKDVSLTSISHTSDYMCSVVACLNGALHIMERSTGTLLNTCFGGHTAGRYSLECNITADDQYLACGSESGAAVIYDFASGRVVQTMQGHTKATCSVACHPSRKHSSVVITGSYDGDAIVWTNGNTIYAGVD